MDSLHLTDAERDLFAELFATLDAENEGKISLASAIDLITRCNLSADVIEKVTELCGAKRLGHFGRSQFYIALKLIACAQNSIPLNVDALANTNSIPLPVFTPCKSPKSHCKTNVTHSRDQQMNTKSTNCQRNNSDSCHLPPPPPTKSNRQRLATVKSVDYSSSPVIQPHISSNNLSKDNCEAIGFLNDDNSSNSSSEAIHSPKNESFGIRMNWTMKDDIVSKWDYGDERHHLLGNEEDSEHAHSSNDDDDNSDIWIISKEQKDYYTKQFKCLEIDIEGKLSGRAAKQFFERSKLSQSVLSKIWKLSDVDKDGALSCEEFCTAMHLVVLRRNNVEIPDVLPMSSKVKDREFNTSRVTPNDIPDCSALSPQNKVWTKFTDSPTNHLITVSSPPDSRTSSSSVVMQPANFDFNAASIERDPKILHPVALRVSPDGRVAYIANEGSTSIITNETFPTACIENLQPQFCTPRKDPPPPPPPRVMKSRGHARSSSLDLNRFSKAQVTHGPVDQQRINTNISPRLSNAAEHRGAFTIYRKCEPQIAAYNWLEVLKLKYPLPAIVPTLNDSDDPLDLLRTVKSLQQRNFYLESIYCDLIQELANALETNTTLEAKIKQLVALK